MQILYIILSFLIIIELFLRRVDCISIAAASFILYSSNCIIGKVWIPQSGYNAYYSDISFQTYSLIIIQLLIIYLFLLFKRYGIESRIQIKSIRYEKSYKQNINNKLYWRFILVLAYGIIGYYLIFKIGLSSFFSYTTKGEILSETSFLFGLSIWGGLICFYHYYLSRKYVGAALSFGIIIISVILGSRAYIATAFVGVLLIISFGWNKRVILNNSKTKRRIILLGTVMLAFLIIYKLVYKEVRAGDFVGALTVLSNSQTWLNLFDIDELRIVCANYNYTVDNHIRLPLSDVMARLLSIIPFANDYIPIEFPLRFSDYLQSSIRTTYGLASNFWGESYAMGGPVFVAFITFAWLFGLSAVNDRLKKTESPFLLTIVSYLSFYIHRLDWTQVMGCLKLVLVLFIVRIIFILLIHRSIVFEYSVSTRGEFR